MAMNRELNEAFKIEKDHGEADLTKDQKWMFQRNLKSFKGLLMTEKRQWLCLVKQSREVCAAQAAAAQETDEEQGAIVAWLRRQHVRLKPTP